MKRNELSSVALVSALALCPEFLWEYTRHDPRPERYDPEFHNFGVEITPADTAAMEAAERKRERKAKKKHERETNKTKP